MKIEVCGVEKSFKNEIVLKEINLQIEEGKIYCLLGASGSGKTTLLNIIMGALAPNRGDVIIDGIKVPDKRLLSRIGFMPQQDALYNELSVWDNLKFFAGIQKVKKSEFKEQSIKVLEIIGMLDKKDKLVGKCSGGMKKRVSLAAALIHNPEILILDEPTVGIDPVLRKKIWGHLSDLKAEGKTIIVTTHVMDEVTECDYATLLRYGKIIKSDRVVDLLKLTKDGKIEELFLVNDKEEV